MKEVHERAVKIVDGNPGAMVAMGELIKSLPREELGRVMLMIEHQELFGPKLHLAFKDYAQFNPDTCATGIISRSPQLRDLLRKRGYTDFEWKD